MFGIGMPEMLLILAVALIVIGPKKLPDLAKSLGRALGEFKKATSELKESIQLDSELKEVKTAFDDINRDLKDSRPSRPDPSAGSPASTDDAPGDRSAPDAAVAGSAAGDRSDAGPVAPDAAATHVDEPPAGTDDAEAEAKKG